MKASATDPDYSHSDAVLASGLDSRTILQWRKRQLFPDLGTRHTTGRFVFNWREIIQLRIVAELVRIARTPPSVAAELAGGLLSGLSDEQIAPGHKPLITWIFRPENTPESSDRHEFETFEREEFASAFGRGDVRTTEGHAAIFLPLSDLIANVDARLLTARKGA